MLSSTNVCVQVVMDLVGACGMEPAIATGRKMKRAAEVELMDAKDSRESEAYDVEYLAFMTTKMMMSIFLMKMTMTRKIKISRTTTKVTKTEKEAY